MKSVVLHIYGNVQGIGFRYSARQKAEELSIVGYVKNEPDGSVLIEAQGKGGKLESFIAWCRQGPPAATVERVDVASAERKEFEGFDVK